VVLGCTCSKDGRYIMYTDGVGLLASQEGGIKRHTATGVQPCNGHVVGKVVEEKTEVVLSLLYKSDRYSCKSHLA
jgi:hypothetical protein